jgi:hypothetical protein
VALGRQLLVIGTSDGVFKSTDGGASWQAIGLQGLDVSAVAFAQYSAPTVIIASIDGVRDAGSRLVRTVDMGANWIPLKEGFPAEMVVSAVAAGRLPENADLRPLFVAGSGGVYKSDNGGDSWALLQLPPQSYSQVATSAYDPNIVYVSSDGGGQNGGVWRSTDRGSTWTALTAGLTEKGVTGLTLGRDAPATLVLATWNPNKPHSAAFVVSDSQAAPGGTPEGGFCPEPGTEGQCEEGSAGAATPGVFAAQDACASPSPSPAASAPAEVPASPAPTPSESPSPAASINPAYGCATPSPSPPAAPGGTSDVPLWVAGGVLFVLAATLVIRLLFTRR